MCKRLCISAYMNYQTANGLGTQLRRLVELLDGDLEKIYREDGFGYRPRYTPVMKALTEISQLTIKDIASFSSISHSAASQTVSKMISEGFIEACSSGDGRERQVRLSVKGHSLLPQLQARWAATRRAADRLDDELEYPISQLLSEAIDALTSTSFAARIQALENTKTEAGV